MNEEESNAWLEQLREIILTYNTNRISDPFLAWFREQDHANAFRNQFERILIILIARALCFRGMIMRCLRSMHFVGKENNSFRRKPLVAYSKKIA
jgi:hypothetical protein